MQEHAGAVVREAAHLSRTVLTLVLVILLTGLLLGWLAGVTLTRAFEAAQLDEIGRDLSGVGTEDPVRADSLRP